MVRSQRKSRVTPVIMGRVERTSRHSYFTVLRFHEVYGISL